MSDKSIRLAGIIDTYAYTLVDSSITLTAQSYGTYSCVATTNIQITLPNLDSSITNWSVKITNPLQSLIPSANSDLSSVVVLFPHTYNSIVLEKKASVQIYWRDNDYLSVINTPNIPPSSYKAFNRRIVLTSSQQYTAPYRGYYKVTCIGAGGGGGGGATTSGDNNRGGTAGGDTLFGSYVSAMGGAGGGAGRVYGSGGGGGGGEVSTGYAFLDVGQVVEVTVGSPGIGSGNDKVNGTGHQLVIGAPMEHLGGGGAPGASNGTCDEGASYYPTPGGAGARTYLGYGGGGGGGMSGDSGGIYSDLCKGAASDGAQYSSGGGVNAGGIGGNGGSGAVIIEYFDESLETSRMLRGKQ